jgi:large subunit ribosomal protein L32
VGLPKKRTSKMRRDRRRASNFKLKPVNVTKCPKCKEPVVSHRVCPSCGTYKGEQVVEAR